MALWTPALLDTALWLDADDAGTFTLDTALVSQWRDKSGNAYHAAQTGSARPTYDDDAINVKPGVVFNNDIWLDGDHGTQNWQDVFVAARWDGGGSVFPSYNALFTGRGGGGGDIGLIGDSGGGGWYPGWPDTVRLNGAAAGTNFETLKAPFVIEASKASAISVDGFKLGMDRTNTSRNWIGVIAEVVAFNSVIGTDDRLKIEGYLAHKWGASGALPSEHPYKSTPPAVFSIFGTVRDKDGALAARRVVAIRESNGTAAGSVISNATTGEFEIVVEHDEPHAIAFIGEADRNGLIFSGVLPS